MAGWVLASCDVPEAETASVLTVLPSGAPIASAVTQSLEEGRRTRVIVVLGEPGPIGLASADALDRRPMDEKVQRFETMSTSVLGVLRPEDAEPTQIFDHLPMMVVDLNSEDGLRQLASAPNVIAIYEDEIVRPFLSASLPLVNQPSVASQGGTGAGTAVAVLDTGTDYTRAAFGGCSSPGEAGCKVVYAEDFAPDDGQLDDDGHGTNVSGIVLGVAPDTDIVDLDVFRAGGAGFASDIIAGINWVIANHANYNIVAMNLSLGGGSYPAECPTSAFAVPLANARAAGILPVVASGNDASANAMATPACVPAAVSVGAVYTSNYPGFRWGAGCTDLNTQPDQITCFSNSSDALTMLAPGALITAGGHTMGGTSQAAPHVAGAVAVLKAAYTQETVEDVLSRLLDNGVPLTDPRNQRVRPRFDLSAAFNAVVADVNPPTGTILVNADATYTNTATVTLTLSATDNVAVTEVCLSNAPSCSSWLPYASSRGWVLPEDEGQATVYAQFRDAASNISSQVSDSIILDRVAPTPGVLQLTTSNQVNSLSWSGATDAESGVVRYILVHGEDFVPADCSGTPLYEGPGTTYVHSGRAAVPIDGYRLCAVDGAGNVGPGAMVKLDPNPNPNPNPDPNADVTPPTGSIELEGGASWANSNVVRLMLSADDPSGVPEMCLSNTATCQSWQSFRTNVLHQLDTNPQTVTVWFKDGAGNESEFSLVVRVDSTPPSDGTLSAVGEDGAVSLSWTGFSDADSGISGYRLVSYGQPWPPATCNQGTVLYEGTATSFIDTGLTNGQRYGYRVCAADEAGLNSPGATAQGYPVLESDPPVGTVIANTGTGWVTSTNVNLTINATDASGIASMCISDSATCTAWRSYRSNVLYRLPVSVTSRANGTLLRPTSTTYTINVFLRDPLGNVGQLATSVQVDSSGPVDGTSTATVANGAVELNWSGFSDPESGIVSYRVVTNERSQAPSNCRQGTRVYEGPLTSTSATGLTNGSIYGFRICAQNAAGAWSQGVTFTAVPKVESEGPVATVIADGGTGWVSSSRVNLTLDATDASGVAAMCVSNTSTCNGWRSYRNRLSHRLDGTPQTIYVFLRDTLGNVSQMTTYVQVDSSIPTDGAISATAHDGSIDLSWSGFDDAESGIQGYRVVSYDRPLAPANCRQGQTVYEGSLTATTLTGLTNGSTYGYRLCAQNAAGAWSTGVTLLTTPKLESDGPEATITVNEGTGWVSSTNVRLTIDASDASGLAAMCVNNTSSTCTSWRSYRNRLSHRIAGSPQTIYVSLRDTLGNVSQVSTSVQVDATEPTDGVLSGVAENGLIRLSWSGFTDTESGISGYRVVSYDRPWAPDSCRRGNLVYEGTMTSADVTGLSNGSTYGYRVCAQNSAGIWSSGTTLIATPLAESDGPEATVTVNTGSGWVNTTGVQLAIDATDASGVAAMCVSNTSTCNAWRSYRNQLWHRLAGSPQTIYVFLRDTLGNVSETMTSVQVDSSAPPDGTANVTPQNGGLDLSWSGFTDPESGITTYRIVTYDRPWAPPTCRQGTVVYEGATASTTLIGLSSGSTYVYRLCAQNGAGVWSSGTVVMGIPN